MNPPSLRTRVLGQPVVSAGLVLMGVLMCYSWWDHRAADVIGLIGLGLTLLGIREYEALAKYKRWRQQWNELAGDGSDDRASGSGAARVGLAVAIYAGLAYVALTPGVVPKDIQDMTLLPLVGLTAGLIIRLLVMIWQGFRRRRAARATVAASQFEVQQALPVARGAISARDALQMLPDYCKRLILRLPPSG